MAQPKKTEDNIEPKKTLTPTEKADIRWGASNQETPQENESLSAKESISPVKQASSRERANKRWGMTPDNQDGSEDNDLASAELNAKEDDGQDAGTNENESQFFNQTSQNATPAKGSASSKKRKRNIIIASVATGLASLTIVAFAALPGFLLNMLRSILVEKIGDLQTSHSRRYRRSKISSISDMFSKEGRMGRKVIADMETRGYKFIFDPDGGRKIIGLVTPAGDNIINSTGAVGQHISDYIEVRHPLRTAKWKTKRMNAFYGRYGVSRQSLIRSTADDLDDPYKQINKNLANFIYDDNADIRLSGGELSDDATQEQIDNNNAARDLASSDGSFDDAKKAIQETGDNLIEIDADLGRIDRTIGAGVDEELQDVIKRVSSSAAPSLGGKAVSTLSTTLNVTDPMDKICIIKNRLRASVTAARAVRALALMKQALAYISAADGMRKGEASSKLLGALMRRTTAKDQNGFAIGASPGFAYALKGKFSKTKNDALKNGHSVNGQLSGIYGGIQDATANLPFTSQRQCGVWQNPITQVGAAAISIVVGIFSGGTSTAATTGLKATVTAAVKSVFTKSVVKALVKTALFELTFEGMMTLLQIYSEKTLNFPVSGQSVGGELGGELIAGAGTSQKQRSLRAGQVPATTEQYAQAYKVYVAEKKEEQKNKSFFARVLDIRDVDSLAFNGVATVAFSANDVPSAANSVYTAFLRSPSSIFSVLSGSLIPKTFAQESSDEIPFETYTTEGDHAGINLATDPAGNLLTIMRTDIESIDPEENITFLSNSGHIDPTTLEPTSSEFKGHVENCVENVDTISWIEGGDPEKPQEDCLANLVITRRFKAHLAYLDMVDTMEAEWLPEEIDDGVTFDSGDPTGETTATFDVNELGNHSDNLSCAAGTIDLGVAESRYTGALRKTGSEPIRMRLCRVPDIPGSGADPTGAVSGGGVVVDARVSGAWRALALAAKANGINLTAASSFRLFDSCGGTGDGSRCATPGTSPHQTGFAIDFNDMSLLGTSTTSCEQRARLPSSPQWVWMEQNAQKYGFKQYTYEAWHWDPLPMANRCGTGQ